MDDTQIRHEFSRIEVGEDLVDLELTLHNELRTLAAQLRGMFEAVTYNVGVFDDRLSDLRERLLERSWEQLPLEDEPADQ